MATAMAKYRWYDIPATSTVAPVDPTGNLTQTEMSQVMNVQKGCVLRTRLGGVIRADVFMPEEYWDGSGFINSAPGNTASRTPGQEMRDTMNTIENATRGG